MGNFLARRKLPEDGGPGRQSYGAKSAISRCEPCSCRGTLFGLGPTNLQVRPYIYLILRHFHSTPANMGKLQPEAARVQFLATLQLLRGYGLQYSAELCCD